MGAKRKIKVSPAFSKAVGTGAKPRRVQGRALAGLGGAQHFLVPKTVHIFSCKMGQNLIEWSSIVSVYDVSTVRRSFYNG